MENCVSGVIAFGTNLQQHVIDEAFIENIQSSSSDSNLEGSFCPIKSGIYTLTFEGTVCQWKHYFTFASSAQIDTPKSIVRHLYKNMCYSYYIYSACTSYTYSKITVQLEGTSAYILNSTESITCLYDGCTNGMLENNNCLPIQPNTCECINKFKTNIIMLSVFISK